MAPRRENGKIKILGQVVDDEKSSLWAGQSPAVIAELQEKQVALGIEDLNRLAETYPEYRPYIHAGIGAQLRAYLSNNGLIFSRRNLVLAFLDLYHDGNLQPAEQPSPRKPLTLAERTVVTRPAPVKLNYSAANANKTEKSLVARFADDPSKTDEERKQIDRDLRKAAYKDRFSRQHPR